MSFKYKLPGENLQVMECETFIFGSSGTMRS